jgi:hypothetical protein
MFLTLVQHTLSKSKEKLRKYFSNIYKFSYKSNGLSIIFSPKLNQPFDEDKDEGEAITSLIKRIFENAVGSEKGRLKKKRNFNAP